MNNALSRRARMLLCVGAGVIMISLAASACESATESAGRSTSTPSSNAETSPRHAPPPASTGGPAAAPSTQPSQQPHSDSADSRPVPVLGTEWGPGQKGYGTVRPSTIFNGGDPTGLVTDVHWQSWGDPVAIGSGMSTDDQNSIVAEATQQKATVEAFNLGMCDGKLMYQAIEWYFPADGAKFNPHSYINICTGEYVGTP
jgi:hypothetical protein